LTLVAAGIILFERKGGGTMPCLREKVICEDFLLFSYFPFRIPFFHVINVTL